MRRQLFLPSCAVALSISVLSMATQRIAHAQASEAVPSPPAAPMPPSDIPPPPPPIAAPIEALPPPPAAPEPYVLPPPPVVDALPPAPPPPPPPAPVKPTVNAKFAADVYGFVEFDSILDSKQSFNEIAGNGVIARSGTYAGNHERLTYSVRNSRIGLKLKGPDSDLVKTSAILEMDFLGNQPTTATEAQLLTNATFRTRHIALKFETPYVDLLAGQTWQLFGWGSYFFPNTVEIMGLPGQVFSRAPQVRLSHAFKTDDITLEVAVATSRSPQRDSGLPDNQAGIRFLVNKWKALHTANSTGTAVDSGGIGVSGVYRHLRVNEFSAAPTGYIGKNAGGISVDALLPIIPATNEDRANALTLTGSYVRGTGIADLFTGLTGGVAYPALADATKTYTPNIDAGLVTYGPTGDLHSIDWQAFLVGVQYYLPPTGSVWVSGNYSHLNSPNMYRYSSKAVKNSQWADGNLFIDVNKAFRLGGEVAWFKQTFLDKTLDANNAPTDTDATATNWRFQASAFYLF